MSKTYRIIAGFALFLCPLLALPVAAKGLGELQQSVVPKLEAAKEALKIEGNLKLLLPPTVGQLPPGASAPYTVQLNAGTEYTFVGLCDEDCHDINLSVTDMNGNEIAADTEVDDYPMITLTPSSTGRFQVNTIMNECSTDFCYFGLGVFGQ